MMHGNTKIKLFILLEDWCWQIPEGNRKLGRPRRRWKANIKIYKSTG